MEVVVEWNFDNGSTYNVSMQWMTLPSHRNFMKLPMCVIVCNQLLQNNAIQVGQP